jgi:acyl-CoA reductase-like NAD-dependent aldehyde dehydrogenase
MTDLVAARQPYVDGKWIRGAAPLVEVESPASGEVVAAVEATALPQVEEAIAAARNAFDRGPWPRLAPEARLDAIRRFGAALEARRGVLVETVIEEAGCPRLVSETTQVGMALASIGELADLYQRLPQWEHNEAPLRDYLVGSNVRLSIRRFEPVGVVAAITPYNFPLITNVWKVVPALLAGCTVVLRPSPLTPLAALVFGEAAEEAGLPPGVLNVVVESGSEGAVLLTTHPGVDAVSFTGSTAVGRAVATQAAPTLKRVILELGGKSVALHLPDVFEAGIGGVVAAALPVFAAHAGQGCALQTRVLVPEAQRAKVVEAVAAASGQLRIGPPSERTTVVGPLISAAQRSRVDDLVRRSVAAGARCASGGRAPGPQARGGV